MWCSGGILSLVLSLMYVPLLGNHSVERDSESWMQGRGCQNGWREGNLGSAQEPGFLDAAGWGKPATERQAS